MFYWEGEDPVWRGTIQVSAFASRTVCDGVSEGVCADSAPGEGDCGVGNEGCPTLCGGCMRGANIVEGVSDEKECGSTVGDAWVLGVAGPCQACKGKHRFGLDVSAYMR